MNTKIIRNCLLLAGYARASLSAKYKCTIASTIMSVHYDLFSLGSIIMHNSQTLSRKEFNHRQFRLSINPLMRPCICV